MSTKAKLAAFIADTLKITSPILGSQLGGRIKKNFPEVNLREYGGLRGFIKSHCENQVVYLGKHELDDVWGSPTSEYPTLPAQASSAPNGVFPSLVNSLPAEVVQSRQISCSPLPDTKTTIVEPSAWETFVNPKSSDKLLVNFSTADLLVLPPNNPIPPNYVEVPKVTNDESRQIAEAFLPVLDSSDQMFMKSILASDDFWRQWFFQIRNRNDGAYTKKWVLFRFERLCGLFQDKLRTLGAPDSSLLQCLENLKRLKARGRTKPVPLRWRELKAPRGSRILGLQESQSSLRTLVVKALDSLNEEQLRQIWLPVGAVVDALPKAYHI